LSRAGFQTFLDVDDLGAGTEWAEQIASELSHASLYGFVVTIVTAWSMSRGFVLDELRMSLAQGARIVPILFEDCAMPPELQRLRIIDARHDSDKALNELVKTLYAWT
jgi:hypothetical protein